MRSRVRWQRVCWVAARGSSASQKTQADFSLVCWQLSRTRSRRPMSNGTSLPAGLSRSSAPLAALSQGWATRCIRPLILVPPSLLHLPTTRVCGDLTCACLRPLVVSMPRYLAARYHSTAPGSLAQHLLLSGCRLSCCAVWPCSRARRGYSATSPKSYATPTHPKPAMCTDYARRRKLWQRLLLSLLPPTIHSSTAPAPRHQRAGPTLRMSGYARWRPT